MLYHLFKKTKLLVTLLMLQSMCLFADKPCWLDLPKDPLENIGNLSEKGLSEVNKLISYYHGIPKTDATKIFERIAILKEIEDKLLIQTNSEKFTLPGKRFLQNIHQATKEKRLYLESLEELRTKLANQKNYINDQLYNIPYEYHTREPLFLVNKRLYDSRIRTYWGEYILEIIDPCHRFLTSYFDLWHEINPGSLDYFSFFIWLEGQNVTFEITSVLFLTEEEISDCEIICRDGKLFSKSTGELFSSDPIKEYLFIIDLNERLLVAIGSKSIRHDSLSHGKPLLSAGNLVIEDGIIVKLGLDSGHYQPKISNGKQLIEILREKGAIFSSDAKIEYFENSGKQTLRLEEFIYKYSDK